MNEKLGILLSQLYIKCKIRVTNRNPEYNNNIRAQSGTIQGDSGQQEKISRQAGEQSQVISYTKPWLQWSQTVCHKSEMNVGLGPFTSRK